MHHIQAVLKGCLLFFILLICLSVPGRSDEYKFVDSEGTEVSFPAGTPFFSQAKPGPWKGLEAEHEPDVKARIRREGLESIRILNVHIPHPMTDANQGKISAIYILDKDGLVIGYHAFGKNEKTADTEIWLNSVINYIQIYVACTKHGMWRKEMRF